MEPRQLSGTGYRGFGAERPPERPGGSPGAVPRVWAQSSSLWGLSDPRARAQAAPRRCYGDRRAGSGAPPPSHRPLRGRGQDGGAGKRRGAMAAGNGTGNCWEGNGKKLLALTEYLPPRPALPPRCLPRPGPRDSQEDGYARVLRAQLQAVLAASRMVAVCQYNSMAEEDVATLRHFLRRHDIHVKFVLNEVARPVLAQSKWRNLLPLFVCRNILLVSPEPRAREMLRVLKGVPQVNLLGACIDDTILSRQGVETLSRLPPLEACRGQTVAALSLPCSHTSSLLQHGPARLAALLDRHIRRLRGTGTAAGSR
ncbi:39S ribosomal protein L10, mitochondrial [Onychostruthus taczanowskii]|uniref:39S ribosomal protein L10, mitochondrial n=1 Tax=Onychostruthus taczanowskii TaxID=356909 RepID=UPI001B807C59|nr:39S ribosomal protein L10, mitochondrial [Onychostruthus taczanowskii]